MEYALIFTAFAVVIAIVVLRFTAIVNQQSTRASTEHLRVLDELDRSHTTAFANAMTALEQVQDRVVNAQVQQQERIIASQMAMFDRTTDMVHGPLPKPGDDAASGDDPRFDLRPPWAPNDDEDTDALLYADPTDGLMPDPPIEPDDNGHRAVSVRPGEGLIPQ